MLLGFTSFFRDLIVAKIDSVIFNVIRVEFSNVVGSGNFNLP